VHLFFLEPTSSPQSLAEDFLALQAMLRRVGWPNPALAGPDAASITKAASIYTRYYKNNLQALNGRIITVNISIKPTMKLK